MFYQLTASQQITSLTLIDLLQLDKIHNFVDNLKQPVKLTSCNKSHRFWAFGWDTIVVKVDSLAKFVLFLIRLTREAQDYAERLAATAGKLKHCVMPMCDRHGAGENLARAWGSVNIETNATKAW